MQNKAGGAKVITLCQIRSKVTILKATRNVHVDRGNCRNNILQ